MCLMIEILMMICCVCVQVVLSVRRSVLLEQCPCLVVEGVVSLMRVTMKVHYCH